jgi:hypothetical protein
MCSLGMKWASITGASTRSNPEPRLMRGLFFAEIKKAAEERL